MCLVSGQRVLFSLFITLWQGELIGKGCWVMSLGRFRGQSSTISPRGRPSLWQSQSSGVFFNAPLTWAQGRRANQGRGAWRVAWCGWLENVGTEKGWTREASSAMLQEFQPRDRWIFFFYSFLEKKKGGFLFHRVGAQNWLWTWGTFRLGRKRGKSFETAPFLIGFLFIYIFFLSFLLFRLTGIISVWFKRSQLSEKVYFQVLCRECRSMSSLQD